MAQKILIAYATKRGSTTGVADVIADVLRESGSTVDVQMVKAVTSLDGYDAVIVGSAMRMGNVLGEVKNFVADHQRSLQRVPVAYFTVGLMVASDNAEHRAQVPGYLDPLKELVVPVAEANFSGKINNASLNLMERFILKMVKTAEGDFRDWGAIRAWAVETQAKLLVSA